MSKIQYNVTNGFDNHRKMLSHYNLSEADLELHERGQWITPVLFHCKPTFHPEDVWWKVDQKLCMAEETAPLAR